MVLVQEVSKESQELMRKALEEVSCICVTNREFVFAVFFFLSFFLLLALVLVSP